jgi:hypothetical protein
MHPLGMWRLRVAEEFHQYGSASYGLLGAAWPVHHTSSGRDDEAVRVYGSRAFLLKGCESDGRRETKDDALHPSPSFVLCRRPFAKAAYFH